ncbi:MAG: CDP-archaeol synthase [Bacteroidetes bacterium]|nr:CDP-archaeol synthase [Bacteroidota bacterium]
MFYKFLSLIIPLIISNTIHMVMVKKNAFSFLKAPISENAFGANKTWRGFIALSLLNGLFTMMFLWALGKHSLQGNFLFGALLGFVYMLFELPNSYIKRRLGIGAGNSSSKYKWLFAFMDKSDSAIGVCLVFFFWASISIFQLFYLILISIALHALVSMVLVQLKIKKSF